MQTECALDIVRPADIDELGRAKHTFGWDWVGVVRLSVTV
jgi:hypothetical protein